MMKSFYGCFAVACLLLCGCNTQVDTVPTPTTGTSPAQNNEVPDHAANRAGPSEAARKDAAGVLALGETFAFDFELADPDGKTVKLGDYAGKVVIVDLWGTWCPPCRAEIPHFIELFHKYKDAGLAIVGINYERADGDEAKQIVKSFVEAQKIPYPCVMGDDKTQTMVPNLEGFPTTLFIDRKGKVRAKVVGAQELDFLEAMVLELLREEA